MRLVRNMKGFIGARTLIVAIHRAPVLQLVDRGHLAEFGTSQRCIATDTTASRRRGHLHLSARRSDLCSSNVKSSIQTNVRCSFVVQIMAWGFAIDWREEFALIGSAYGVRRASFAHMRL